MGKAHDDVAEALRLARDDCRQWAAQGRASRRHLRFAAVLDGLSGKRGARIRTWLVKHHEQARDRLSSPAQHAVALGIYAAVQQPLSPWETRGVVDKRRALGRLKQLADELADLLERDDAPPVPHALSLFEREHLPPPLYPDSLSASRTPEHLWPLYEQRLGPMLRELARWAQLPGHDRLRDARPNTGMASARVLTRSLARWLNDRYDAPTPYASIANLVCLALPELHDSVTGEQIKDWLK